jgi:hypothetical protein
MTITTLAGFFVLGFLALLGGTLIALIWKGKIDLTRLISEPNGDASMSRFQLLIFTFVIAASLFLVVAGHDGGPEFPDQIPQGVLLLLGISSSSYLVSKGIQFSAAEGIEDRPALVTISPTSATAHVGGPCISFKATVIRTTNEDVTWTLDLTHAGTIDAKTGVYTPPNVLPPGVVLPLSLTVRATSVADASGFATASLILS